MSAPTIIRCPVWDPSTFSKNREHRFDASGIFEKLFDDTVLHAKSKVDDNDKGNHSVGWHGEKRYLAEIRRYSQRWELN